ncbi:MAG: RNA polymerase subunit sigma [Hydrogenophilales bacterium CG12_big_fil_rev_8_21_14_0_65_61_21]|nr:MAG: RNA polymerase subunit sigma [Hydrogenophilales bacterium CG12_big_fil_rev_8_21_14_0_65_61_21]
MLTHHDFEHLVRAYSAELFRFAYWQCRDRGLAEDLVQETFARAWKAREQLHGLEAVKPWLYRILRNEHARLYERRGLPMEDCEFSELPIADGSDLERDYAIREQVAMLSPQYREPLLMQVLGGLSCAEIGENLGIGEAAVMQRLSRARLALRRLWLGEPASARKEK